MEQEQERPAPTSIPRAWTITQVYMFIANGGDDGQESVVALGTALGWMPMVATDYGFVEAMRPKAARIAKDKGMQIRLIKISGNVEVLERFEP